ncbi:hypothetical protein vseg_004157 [Gypsophila vaccaria]
MDNNQQLLPGFRFYPTEEELINFYLHTKLHCHHPEIDRLIPSVEIYNFEPSQLPEQAGERCKGDNEQWFFFVGQQEREARGGRPNRTTATGYWKATGSPSYVYSSENKVIGVKKTMVFYKGRAPTGSKTKWKMNEYKAIVQDDANSNDPSFSSTFPKLRNEVSLCRIYVTSGCARAFDRRPPGTNTTTATTTTSTLLKVDASRREIGQGSGSREVINYNNGATTLTFEEKSSSVIISNTDDNSSNLVGQIHRGTPLLIPQTNANNNTTCDDFEMTDSLDDSLLIEWDQLVRFWL